MLQAYLLLSGWNYLSHGIDLHIHCKNITGQVTSFKKKAMRKFKSILKNCFPDVSVGWVSSEFQNQNKILSEKGRNVV